MGMSKRYNVTVDDEFGKEDDGDMPRSHQVGYVFSEDAKYSDAKTIAHELGHGLYSFEHTFENKGAKQGSTDNLMDYNDGIADKMLKVWQWNLLYTHKNYTVPFLEDDEDAMRTTDKYYMTMSKNIFENIFIPTIGSLFKEYPDLNKLFTASYIALDNGATRRIPASTVSFANTIQSITAINDSDPMEIFSVALISGIIYSATTDKGLSVTNDIEGRTEVTDGTNLNFGNLGTVSVCPISLINSNPNDSSPSIRTTELAETDYSISFVHETVHQRTWAQPERKTYTTQERLAIAAGTLDVPSGPENLFNDNWLQKYSMDCAIQIENFVRMYMYRKQNRTTDVSQCMVRTTRGHHDWPEDKNDQDRILFYRNRGRYHMRASELIQLPQNVFDFLTPSVYNALIGVNGRGQKIQGHRNLIPEIYRTSYYGYK